MGLVTSASVKPSGSVRAHPATTGGRVCSVCLRIDRGLGLRHDAVLLTPLDDAWARADGVVHHRVFPDDDAAAERLREHHVRRVVTMANAVQQTTGRTPAPRWPGGPSWARIVQLDV